MNNEYYNNKYNAQESSVIFWEDILEKLSKRDKEIFRILVSSGVSEEKEAKELIINSFIYKQEKPPSMNAAYLSIKTFSDMGLLDKKRMSTGYRPFNILIITDLGKQIYRMLFKKEPPEQEHMKLAGEHASVQHAYMIKDVKTILEKTGNYNRVTMGRKENHIALPEGRTIIPDVIATISPYHRHFIEVECGNHHQNDFNDKCNRLVSLSRSIIIVGGSRNEVTRILKPQVENFIRFKGRNVLKISQTHIYLFSISDLSKGIITYHYDMNLDEPICGFGRKAKEVYDNEQ